MVICILLILTFQIINHGKRIFLNQEKIVGFFLKNSQIFTMFVFLRDVRST